MSKSQLANVNNTALTLVPFEFSPEIDPKLLQTFSREMGWDANNGIWRMLLTDVDGRLLVSTSVTQGANANQFALNVGLASVQIIGANNSRRTIIIQNLGINSIYVNFGSNGSTVTGLVIPSNGTLIEDHFLGAINAISLGATNDVHIVEF